MVSQDEVCASRSVAAPDLQRSASWSAFACGSSSPSPYVDTPENYQVFDSLEAELDIETVNALLSVAEAQPLQVGQKRVREDSEYESAQPELPSGQYEVIASSTPQSGPSIAGPPSRKRMRVKTRARARRHANLKGLLDAGLLRIGEKIRMQGKAGLVMKEGWIEYPDTNERYPGAWTWANAIAEEGVDVPNLRASLSTQAEEQFGWESTMVESDGVPLQEFTEMYSAKELELAAARREQQALNARKREEQLAREQRHQGKQKRHQSTEKKSPRKAAAKKASATKRIADKAESENSSPDFTVWVRKRKAAASSPEHASPESASSMEDRVPEEASLPGSVSQSMLEDLLHVAKESPVPQSLRSLGSLESLEYVNSCGDSPMMDLPGIGGDLEGIGGVCQVRNEAAGLPSSAERGSMGSWEHGLLEDEDVADLPRSILKSARAEQTKCRRKRVSWANHLVSATEESGGLEEQMEDVEEDVADVDVELADGMEVEDEEEQMADVDVELAEGLEVEDEEVDINLSASEGVGSYASPPDDFLPDSAEEYPIIDGGYLASEEEEPNSLVAEAGSSGSESSILPFVERPQPTKSTTKITTRIANTKTVTVPKITPTKATRMPKLSPKPNALPKAAVRPLCAPEASSQRSGLSKLSSPVLAASGLTSTMLHRIRALLAHLGGKIVTNMCSEVTHLVVLPNPTCAAPQKRTMKFMEAVLLGCHVVSYDWILQSIRERSWANESNFVITPPRTGCRIFDGLRFALYGDFDSARASKCDLLHLINLGGGKVYRRLPSLPATAAEEPRNKKDSMVVLCDADSTDVAMAEACFFEHGLPPLQYEYLFDCISNQKVLPLHPYAVCGLEDSSAMESLDMQTQSSIAL